MQFYVELTSTRRYSASVQAKDAEEAKTILRGIVCDGLMEPDTTDVEISACRDAVRDEATA